ncbi:unnamed protein product [Closterium sp. Yama58-4]|nr:unnamed protein product [Closterium sp. Yama58-4]
MARLSVAFLALLLLAVIICAEAGKASTLSKKGSKDKKGGVKKGEVKAGGEVKSGVKAGGEVKSGVKAGGEIKAGVKAGGEIKVGVKKGGSKKGGSKKGGSKKPVTTSRQVGASSAKGAELTSNSDSYNTFDAGEVTIKGVSWNAKQCPNDLAKKDWGGCTAVNCSKGGWPAKFKTSIITAKKGKHWATILPNGGFSKKKANPEACCNQCAASHDCTYWQYIPGNGGEPGTCDLMAGEQKFECGDLAAMYEGKDKPVYLQGAALVVDGKAVHTWIK